MTSATSTRQLALAIFLAGALCAGCGGSSSNSGPDGTTTPKLAFGSHTAMYTAGVIRPSGNQDDLDAAVKTKYQEWKARYLIQGCGGYYVCAADVPGACVNDGLALTKNGGIGPDGQPLDQTMTVSEGHGYGMLIAVLMAGLEPDARTIFDGFVTVRKKFPSPYNANLMAWQMNAGCTGPAPEDNDAATDGDLDSAFALLLAEQQWASPKYGQQARDVIQAVSDREMNPTTHLPLLGDWALPTDEPEMGIQDYYATRLSDHMTDHFRSFQKANMNGGFDWGAAVTGVYDLMDKMQTTYAPMTGLVPDFVSDTNTATPMPISVDYADNVLGEDLTTNYDYNSCRVPWRLGTDYIINGEAKAKTVLTKMNDFIKMTTKGDPTMILDGYSFAGVPHSDAGPNGCFTGSFGVSAMIDSSNQAWLDAIWKNLVTTPADDYYGDTIRLISMIIMSGNWWNP
ncbi:MAG TPA: glycosyl hydrolase family 8 [Polyangia bacterium]|nr:glycosyl hydrolase family 8 [Polyangia bacterium]